MATIKKNNNEGENNNKKQKKQNDSKKNYEKESLRNIPNPYVESYMSYQILTPYNPPPKWINKKMEETYDFFNNLCFAARDLVKSDCEMNGYRHLIEFLEDTEKGIQNAITDIINYNYRLFSPLIVICERVAIIPFVYGECLGVNETFPIYQQLYEGMIKRFLTTMASMDNIDDYKGNACLVAVSYSIMEPNKPVALFGRYGDSSQEFQRIVFNDQEYPFNNDDGIDDEEY